MEHTEMPIVTPRTPALVGVFSWTGLVLAILVAPLFGLVWAWVGEVAQFYFAPIILFPLLLGVSAGVSVVGLVRLAQVGHRPTIVLAAVLAAVLASGGQHYFRYLTTYSSASQSVSTGIAGGQDLSPVLREMRPSFGQYMLAQAKRGRPLLGDYSARGWLAWLTWVVDLLLSVAAAVVVVVPAMRVPYCNRCKTWYRTIRVGRIDRATAQRLAELLGVEEIDQLHSPRYRLSACQGGCGPTRCELSWEESNGAVDLAQVWLDAAQRNHVATILDGLESETDD